MPGDVGRDLDAVREAHARDLPESRVRLLRGRRLHLGAHAAALRAGLQGGRFRLVTDGFAALSHELADRRHGTFETPSERLTSRLRTIEWRTRPQGGRFPGATRRMTPGRSPGKPADHKDAPQRAVKLDPPASDRRCARPSPVSRARRTLRASRKTSGRATLEPGALRSIFSRVAQASSTGRAVNSRMPRGAPARSRTRDVLRRPSRGPAGPGQTPRHGGTEAGR